MSKQNGMMKRFVKLAMLLMMGASLNACAGLFGFGGTSWREEVLLHDGQKIIVKRSQSYGGRHEIGQSAPIKEHTLSLALPKTNTSLSFKSEFSEDVGRANFNLLALHVLNGTPYIVAEPNLCLSYNKWGRPNPPYVLFKFDGKEWQRIQLSELPAEFKTINLIVNNGREEDIERAQSELGYVSAEGGQGLNSSLTQPEYKTILREPIQSAGAGCGELIRKGNGGWEGTYWFSSQPSKEACFKYCEQNEVSAKDCPCNRFFKGAK
ncbi:MAG: hypothetical protein PHV02_16325 [Rhodocyclaceae bacterium]|nr:hypothetical protein [Rhodocyclaceae bacterium]